MKFPSIDVLYEDNHLLVVNKPAELATMGVEQGESSLVLWGKDYLKKKYNKPGNVFLGIVSRLDSFTSGTIVLARTSKAASRLSAQFRENRVGKLYLAVTEGPIKELSQWAGRSEDDCGSENEDPFSQLRLRFCLKDQIWKDDAARRMRTGSPPTHNAEKIQSATLQFDTLCQTSEGSLNIIRLLTGRKHQIRVQFASRGTPVYGDRKYGSEKSFSKGIALHCFGLHITHPTTKKSMVFLSKPPASWNRFGGFSVEPGQWGEVFQKNVESGSLTPPKELNGNVQSMVTNFQKCWEQNWPPGFVFGS